MGSGFGAVDSPRLRCTGRPSLPLRGKEGERFFLFFDPLSAAGEERVVERSKDRVSQRHGFQNVRLYFFIFGRTIAPIL